ncbi:MAG: hypothetical protein DI582_01320 [Azospirillum brasilense]|nr:MAG: hypothetical protein DI582_01320 [Azospirillum brasilense]
MRTLRVMSAVWLCALALPAAAAVDNRCDDFHANQTMATLKTEQWPGCRTDRDCVAVQSLCGQTIAINKAFQKEHALFALCTAPMVKCAPTKPMNKPVVRCVEQRCTAHEG